MKNMKNCRLYAPNGKPIKGIEARDGSVISCTHIKWENDSVGGNTVIYQVPDISKLSNETILIDEDGKKWSEADVWYASIK